MTKEREQENMIKEIKKEAINMLNDMERVYDSSEVAESLRYATENKEFIYSIDVKPKSIEDLYNLYVVNKQVFRPLIPLTNISLDKEKVDFDAAKSMILNANEDNLIEKLDEIKKFPVLPGDQIERKMNRIILESVNETIEKIKGGK